VLKRLTSDAAGIFEARVQCTALEAISILVRRLVATSEIRPTLELMTCVFFSFPSLAEQMTVHLRRFLTTPISLFESDASQEPPETLVQAAKTFGVCIEVLNQEDIMTSTTYSLLNFLPGGQGGYAASTAESIPAGRRSEAASVMHYQAGPTASQRTTVGINMLYVVAHLALQFRKPDVSISPFCFYFFYSLLTCVLISGITRSPS
jgi:hypothetical protein